MSRPWLRHPARTIQPPPCPTRLPRFATLDLAHRALMPGLGTHTLTAQTCEQCGGAHITETP